MTTEEQAHALAVIERWLRGQLNHDFPRTNDRSLGDSSTEGSQISLEL
ncbi:MAG: hypothetical protein ACJ796_09905 [Gemmatimonadaceae bacterium]